MNLLHENHYSTVVDLEEEAVEIVRFAYQMRDKNRNMGSITYLELDKRHQLSKNQIENALCTNVVNLGRVVGGNKNFKFYARLIRVNIAINYMKTEIIRGQDDLCEFKTTVRDRKIRGENF